MFLAAAAGCSRDSDRPGNSGQAAAYNAFPLKEPTDAHSIHSFWHHSADAGVSSAGCAPLVTQSPGGKLSPVNAVAMDGNDRVILKGADGGLSFTQNAYKQGNPAIKST